MPQDLDASLAAEDRHVPVLLETSIELLAPALRGHAPVLIDGTLGLGGHSEAFLRTFADLRIIGIDRDESALRLATDRLATFGDRFTPVHSTYDQIPAVLEELGIENVQGILLDLGVSSMQIDEAERGFSYRQDAPLDMRMDQSTPLTAAEILNTYSVQDLTRILRVYGEERFAVRIAQRIVARRADREWTSSADLVELVRQAIPAATRKTGGNPAKRTFQALRIEVNAELEVLERTLPRAIDAIDVGGRVAIMSYHSLEDRLVKQTFAVGATSRTPHGLPVEIESDAAYLSLVTRGAVKASEQEIARNPRAASVRLRVAERTRPTRMDLNRGIS